MSNETPPDKPLIYPLRSTEHLGRLKPEDLKIEPLDLSKEELVAVLKYEAGYFSRLKPLDDLSPKIHTIYPGWLMTDGGWQTAQEVYQKAGVNLEGKRPTTVQKVEEVFFQLPDLSQIDKKEREKVEDGSKIWARKKFLQEFEAAGGNLEQVVDPYRISKIGDIGALGDKVQGLRDLKKEIKKTEDSLKEDSSNLGEAERIVLMLYRRRINTMLAGLYTEGAVLSRQPNLSARDKEIIDNIRGRKIDREASSDRLADNRIGRTMERIDHFLQGVGLEIGEDGYYKTIPGELADFVKKRVREPWGKTEEYKKYEKYLIKSAESEKIAQQILQAFGLIDWGTRIKPGKTGLSVDYKEEGKVVKLFNIPGNLDAKPGFLPDYFAAESHEACHALRYSNAEDCPLGLVQELSTGRSIGLSEAGANNFQGKVTEALFGMKGEFKGYYYWALSAKQEGGSFKNCFAAVLRAQNGGNLEMAFRRALRVFEGGQVPLSDKSGFLVNSETLAYHEEELVVQKLEQLGLEKLLYIAGLDIYSIMDLQRLGMLDLDKVKKPDIEKIKQIWEKIKAEKNN
jgi:hypothetical protein